MPTEDNSAEPTTFQKLLAIAGGAVAFSAVSYGTTRLLKRWFEKDEENTIVVVLNPSDFEDQPELEKGDES